MRLLTLAPIIIKSSLVVLVVETGTLIGTEGEMNRGRDDGGMDRGREREGVLLIIRNVSFICFSLRCM